MRGELATTGTLVEYFSMERTAYEIQLPPVPADDEMYPAVSDACHGPLTEDEQAGFHNASFVDDNGICATRDRIVDALHQSLVAAFILFGWPHQDRRSRCCLLYPSDASDQEDTVSLAVCCLMKNNL